MKRWRIKTSMVAVSIVCMLAASPARGEEAVPPGELESLKQMMQEIISENQELRKRVGELEGEMTKLKATMSKNRQEQPTEESAKAPITEPTEEAITVREPTKEPTVEAAMEPTKPAEGLGIIFKPHVEFGGAIEVAFDWAQDFAGVTESNIRLRTAEFDFDITANEWVMGSLQVAWDDARDVFTVDQAFIIIGNAAQFPLLLTAGRVVAPFTISTGAILGDTLSISDPLTIEVFETKEDALWLGFELDGFNAGGYAFNGQTNTGGGPDIVDQFGGYLGYRWRNGDMSLDARFDAISSVFDSNALAVAYPEALTAGYAPGISAHTRFGMGGFSFIGEYDTALRDTKFNQVVGFTVDGDPITRLVSKKPQAWMVEGGYTTEILGKMTWVALDYSQTSGLAGRFPKARLLTTVGMWIFDFLRLDFEYGYEWDYSVAEGGTGRNADTFISRVTFEW
jgi:hypothetical protein